MKSRQQNDDRPALYDCVILTQPVSPIMFCYPIRYRLKNFPHFEPKNDPLSSWFLFRFKTVVVLFHSVQCALCSIMTQSVLMTSKILAELTGHIDFVRIDGDRNDLPWQYTMAKFPSLIVFDANR